jgi:hypothetical protein
MKPSPAAIVLLVTLSMLAGCGSDTPTAPTPPPVAEQPSSPPATLTGLVVFNPESLIVTGSSLAFRANGRYSDGSLRTVEPQWFASPATAAEISPAGVLTAHRTGDITITARFAGFETQTTVRVTPNYAGTWRGTWRRLECFGPRCAQGDASNPVIDLFITQATNGRETAAVMLFGPWDATRYTLSGRGLSLGAEASLSVFWLERGPAGERLLEITGAGPVTMSDRQTINGRLSVRFTEGRDITRLELALQELALLSRTVRAPEP